MLILLNTLIAIVGNSYNKVVDNRELYIYRHKQELNVEFVRYLDVYRHVFKKLEKFDLLCIVSQKVDQDETSQQNIVLIWKYYSYYGIR